jgi:pyruvate kinase
MKRIDHQSTKIVATVGPASSSYDSLFKMVEAGVDVFRINFSHGTHSEHEKVINKIRYINEKYRQHIGILADLQGPKLRVGKVKEGVELKEGETIEFTTKQCEGDHHCVHMKYESFALDVNIGELVLVDDGKISLKVLETNKKDKVLLEVIHGGKLSSFKGVNLPNTKVSLPSLTEKDLSDLEFIFTQPIHWIALSFVRSPLDVEDLQKLIEKNKHRAKVIAKIEKPEAVENLDDIIQMSNGIMIARGDLGVEMPLEQVPSIQKEIITKCMQCSKPVIVATQMMESMLVNPSPTRAEVSDVANAVLDGADAVMLSGETAVGKYPTGVVTAMNRIIDEAEKHYRYHNLHPRTSPESSTFYSDVLCFNASKVSQEVGARAIIGMTYSGYTAFKISSCRPKSRIFIFSENPEILATLNLVWGVRCYYYGRFTTTDETIKDVNELLKMKGAIKPGDLVINTGSMPISMRLRTNMLRITKIEL